MNVPNPNQIIHGLRTAPYLSEALSWLAFIIAASITAKFIVPGDEKLGWIRTFVIGMLGAVLGGIGAAALDIKVRLGWNFFGFVTAVCGTIVCLLMNRIVTRS